MNENVGIVEKSTYEFIFHSDLLSHYVQNTEHVMCPCLSNNNNNSTNYRTSSYFTKHIDSEKCNDNDLSLVLREVWSQPLMKCVDSSPLILKYTSSSGIDKSESHQFSGTATIVADGNSASGNNSINNISCMSVAYIGSHGGDLIAVDVESNTLLWQLILHSRVESSVGCWCPNNINMTTDKVVEPFLFVPSYSANDVDGHNDIIRKDGNIGTLWCVGAVSGKVYWELGLPGELKSPPVIDIAHNLIIVGCYDGKVYRIHILTGQIYDFIDCYGSVYASITIDISNTFILVGTIKGSLHCIDLIEKQMNVSNTSSLKLRYTMILDSAIYSSPLLYEMEGNLSIIVGDISGKLSLLNQNDGVVLWQYQVSRAIFSSPYIVTLHPGGQSQSQSQDPLTTVATTDTSDSTKTHWVIFGSHDGFLRCLDLLQKQLVWETYLNSVIFSSPIITQIKTTSVVIACSTAGMMYILSLTNGNILDEIQLKAEIFSSPKGLITSDTTITVLVGARDDRLHAFELTFQQ